MQNILAITNRTLAPNSYWEQLEKIAASDVSTLILREKTLNEEDYMTYARQALQICNAHGKTCILHHFGKTAIQLHVPRFQCSLSYLRIHSSIRYFMTTLGVSVHTAGEAKEAEELGATYIMASHIFETNCKPDSPPIGISELKNICNAVSIPVYALGGITEKNIAALSALPISGIALMSSLMTCSDIPAYLKQLDNN